jgi:hypothetical protein
LAAINHRSSRKKQRRREPPERQERLEHLEHLEHLERLRQHQKNNRRRISGYIFAKRIYPKSPNLAALDRRGVLAGNLGERGANDQSGNSLRRLSMVALIGGLVAVALGLIGLGIWWKQIIGLLAGGVPLLLLLGGAVAVYLGYDEVKDKFIKKAEPPVYEPPKVSEVEVVQYKGEEERLEAKIE